MTRKEVFNSLLNYMLGNVEICINRADDVAMSNEMILEKVKQIMKKNYRKNKKLFEDVKVLSVDRVNSYKCIRELYIANKQLEWIDAIDSKEEVFHFLFVHLVGFQV